MALRDAITVAAVYPGTQCTVAKLLLQLSGDDRQAFEDAMGNVNIPTSQIAKALREEGYTITRSPLARHRRGECNCGTR